MWEYFVILILIIILIYIFCGNTICSKYLYGFWIADDMFCEKAEIESMQIFIGESAGKISCEHICYIIIMDNLCNQGFTLSYLNQINKYKYTINCNVQFDETQIWPEKVTMELDIIGGMLTFYVESKIYAKLYKQMDTTNICRENSECELSN